MVIENTNRIERIVYPKTKGASERGSGGLLTPSHFNDVPFADDISQSSDNVKQRSIKDLDADYMVAVEAGDMKKAQKMVDEAAERGGFIVQKNTIVCLQTEYLIVK